MAITYDVNNSKTSALRSGWCLWQLKELMVASGMWTVFGSGDGSSRYAYSGETAALPGGQQGSGGDFDCLQSGSGGDAGGAGDWGPGGWCVMQDAAGRQVMFVDAADTPASSWNGYGRVAYSRAVGFDGSVATATVIPGLASDEGWIESDRATANGVELFDYNTAGYVHFWCHDSLVENVAGYGWLSVESAGAFSRFHAFTAMHEADGNGQGDRSAFVISSSVAKGWTLAGHTYGYWDSTGTMLDGVSGNLPVEPQGGDDPMTAIYVVTGVGLDDITAADMGYCEDVWRNKVSGRTYPDLSDDGTRAWIITPNGVSLPWPGTGTTPLGGSSTTRNTMRLVPPYNDVGNLAVQVNQELAPFNYLQKVWDISNSRWCYYTKANIDVSPGTSETSPTHSGSINQHRLLSVTPG